MGAAAHRPHAGRAANANEPSPEVAVTSPLLALLPSQDPGGLDEFVLAVKIGRISTDIPANAVAIDSYCRPKDEWISLLKVHHKLTRQ